jgi:membrane protein implicated in regulation of membrane protease activity
MSWSDFYLLCFLIGFSLSVLSFVAGAWHLHLPFKMHLPFHGALHGAHHAGGAALRGGTHISWFNISSLLAFLTWFGGTGYILTGHSHFVAIVSLAIATFAGLFAGWMVFAFMAKIVKTTDAQLRDWDFRMEGSVGTVSMPIRENGTGEMIFEQAGVRKSVCARSEDGDSLPLGAEVVISRYDGGVAYVKRWEDFTK